MNTRWRIAQALEIRWWQQYLAGKETTVYLAEKRRYWRRVLRETGFDIVPGERVLDAGCGPAGIFMVLEKQEVTALDPLVAAYESKLPQFSRQQYPAVNFLCMPLEKLTVDIPFDKVCCLNAINHVRDLALSLDRLVAALRPGGHLLLTVDVHRYRRLKMLFQWLPGDLLHPHQYVLEDYLRMVEERGCSVLRTGRLKPGRIFDYFFMVAQKPPL